MELRSTGNPDISNPATMSMLEYLRKKGIEAMGMTNGKRIRSMTDEELATLLLFFVPTNFDRAMYTGISGKYTRTSEETFDNNLEWLKQPVEE